MMRKIFCLIFLFFSALSSIAQDKGGTGPKEKTVSQELRQKKALKAQNRERRRLERAERKKIKKHHKRIQTKKVRKRMKESKGTALRNNEHKREFFMKRWFKKKNKSRGKSRKKD